ncbi:cupin domain-containing protein [Trebonia kvetii]|uniref:Cupin domain-containing protein n=1 Tax=Trebonia kvetii TaxID=2480626 RepID=A0A6P2BWS9_9ACTN|nr:cupin domain-containing protein [Trebonia kvetii]TVZ03599.1 cupin domain-containing protein [Trebonia kvetii]
MTSYTEELRLGGAIRARRRRLGMTLVEVAASAGLSHPFLSQLERGLARPSMRSLTAIAATLGTTAQALMADTELPAAPDTEPVSVVRRASDLVAPVDSPGGYVRPLVRGERAMLPVEFNGAPREFDEYYRHDGEEFVYVVQGLIEVDIEGGFHTASAGDGVYYPGGLRHRWRSLSDEDVRLVVVQQNRPPATDSHGEPPN